MGTLAAALGQGLLYEVMNLAGLWKLPVIYVCENNLYAMGSALSITESVTDFTAKAASYGVAAVALNGMDVLAVEAAARDAVRAMRAGSGPYFIEARTYRFRAHSMFDAELYRAKAEVEDWKKHGPLITLTSRMKTEGILTEEDFQSLTEDVEREVAETVAFAEAGTWEPVADLTRFVHSESVSAYGVRSSALQVPSSLHALHDLPAFHAVVTVWIVPPEAQPSTRFDTFAGR